MLEQRNYQWPEELVNKYSLRWPSKSSLALRKAFDTSGAASLAESRERVLAYNIISNGRGAEWLVDKQFFQTTVGDLGYNVPGYEVLDPKDCDRVRDNLYSKMRPYLDQGVIAKPLAGSRGRGVFVMRDESALVGFLDADQDWRYMLQPYVEMKEYRWGFYEDNQETAWRFAWEKRKTEVVGNGVLPVSALVLRDKAIHPLERLRLIRQLGVGGVRDVLEDAACLRLTDISNPDRGGHSRNIERSGPFVDRLDGTMNTLVDELGTAVGQRLRHVCFDVGITDQETFMGCDEVGGRKKIVFPVEFQMPYLNRIYFAISPYGLSDRFLSYVAFNSLINEEMVGRYEELVV